MNLNPSRNTLVWPLVFVSTLVAASACDVNEHSTTSASGGGGNGGQNDSSSSVSSSVSGSGMSSTSSSGSSSGSGGGVMGSGNLPVPPGANNVPKPAGAATNLVVLPWAGFKAAVSYSLDDAQPSQIEHWPELKATGVRMTFYLNTSTTGASFDATWKEALSLGSELGNHTVHHCNFDQACNGAPAGSSVSEIDDNTKYIQTNLGAPGVWTMAYPFGDIGYKTEAQARFFLARGVFTGLIAPGDNSDAFNLPCYAVKGNETAADLNGVIDSTQTQGRWLIFLFHSILPTNQNWYAGVDIGSITGSISHAQGFGNVWLDNVLQIGAYWMGQKTIAGATSQPMGGGTKWTWTLPAHFPPGRFVRVKVDGGSLQQGGNALPWDGHGYYEVSLDAGELTLTP